jgi:hypothetical protein
VKRVPPLGLAAVATLLAAGCDGSSNRPSATGNGAVAFSRCMRSRGVPTFPMPDPDSRGIPGMQVKAFPLTVVGLAGLVLAAAGCGGSATRPAASTQTAGAVAFSDCMRAHGVPSLPDPTSAGSIPKESLQQLGVGSARFQAAQDACGSLLPNGGRPLNQPEQRQIAAQALRFSRCVRAHGVPSFPDPGSDGRIPDPATVGINQGSPAFEAANDVCARYRPPYIPSNAGYNAWARSHGG